VSFAAITLCVASQRVFIVVLVYFVIDSVRKLLDTPSYISPKKKKKGINKTCIFLNLFIHVSLPSHKFVMSTNAVRGFGGVQWHNVGIKYRENLSINLKLNEVISHAYLFLLKNTES